MTNEIRYRAQVREEFVTFNVHNDPVSIFFTEDGIAMAVLQSEILNNPMPIGLELPLL